MQIHLPPRENHLIRPQPRLTSEAYRHILGVSTFFLLVSIGVLVFTRLSVDSWAQVALMNEMRYWALIAISNAAIIIFQIGWWWADVFRWKQEKAVALETDNIAAKSEELIHEQQLAIILNTWAINSTWLPKKTRDIAENRAMTILKHNAGLTAQMLEELN